MSGLDPWIAVLDKIKGLREFTVGWGGGGDPYLHLQMSKQPRPLTVPYQVCCVNVMVKNNTPQELIDQIPLFFHDGQENLPVMVLFASQNDPKYPAAWCEVRRRLHTNEVIDTPDWGELLGLKKPR